MKSRVVALPEVRKYFAELMQILYDKGYFSFEDYAIEYVTDLFADIEQNLPTKSKKPAPAYFERYGKNMFYASFRKSRHTQWYVFFTIHTDAFLDVKTFLIRYVSNNHVAAQYLFDDN
ncbi:MAG: hypothetical protein IK084_01010 [Bacteroidaceae bacterium]|nr:hypothetical protein [Bacteroidaceae bacterium]